MKTKSLFLIAVISIISLSSCENKKNTENKQEVVTSIKTIDSPAVTTEYIVFNEKETNEIISLLKKIQRRSHSPMHLKHGEGKRRDIYFDLYYDFFNNWSNYLPDFTPVFYVKDEKELNGYCLTNQYYLEYKYNLINPNKIEKSMRLNFLEHLFSYKENLYKYREITVNDHKKIKSDFISLLKFIDHQQR